MKGVLALWFSVCWCIACSVGLSLSAQELPPAETPEPHAWIATAPPAFARAIELGRVRIGTDDARLAQARKHALTVFRFHVEYRYRYSLQREERIPEDLSRMRAQVVAKITIKELELQHLIVLQTGFQPRDPWSTPLLRHEFDHVSISTDPRLVALARRVLQRPLRCQVEWPIEKDLDHQTVDQAVNEGMSAQIAELERIVQANYDRLDKESLDGQANLSERDSFFIDLYAKEWLRKCEFKYLDVLRVSAQDSSDKDVREHYLLLDPP